MSVLLNVQLSVFGNYHIDTSADNVTKLMGKLNELGKFEFLPNIVNGQNIDLLGGKVDTVSNLSFITPTGQCQIMCMDERIDCTINFNEATQEDTDSSLEFANSALNVIMASFPILGNRLAINVNELSVPFIGSVTDTKIGKAMVSNLRYYQDKELKEWSTRSNAQVPIIINNEKEMLNVISEMKTVINNQTQEKRVLYHVDFNTVPQNRGFRFSKECLTEFVESGKGMIKQLLSQFEELSNCE